MKLLRLSGHSGAGKTRLVNALPQFGITCPKVVRYTSRLPREEEIDGEDYFFRSREFIESLPEEDFLVGPVRNVLQAFDLKRLTVDLTTHDLVLIEIYPDLWPGLVKRIQQRLNETLTSASVFMTAVDPNVILGMQDEKSKAAYISDNVKKNLIWRNKDSMSDIGIRSMAAIKEILEAIAPEGQASYQKIIYSAPEGPDGEDEWTKSGSPSGQAKEALEEFIRFYQRLRK
jgi:hypothetical protein